ncbi:hypothetical protein GWG54_19690 [Natronococcus sp. JC468]|uniref:hypothetical protein n=1 Tax=Natronococcus sp. JC468 TaxID=1961921 RepID=UPI0014387214|nr:hypothetical protein [Natronococcus sp. JC468]NKE37975.1 hypothetical protein [Natronococcus sp. JC468]
MEEVTSTTLHQFGSGLLIEIIGVDERGDIAVETIEFEVLELEGKIVTPREEIPSEYEDQIRATLSEQSYSISDK